MGNRRLTILVTVALAVGWLGVLTGPAAAAPGDLDSTFAGTGIAFFDPAVGQDEGRGAAVQPDGKVLLFGEAGTGDFGLVRLKTNGDPDTTFGGGDAKVITNFGATDTANAAAVTSGGRIVLVGDRKVSNSQVDIAVARYLPGGSLDKTFSGDGKAAFSPGARDRGLGVALQPNGKIVVAGAADGAFAVLRVLPDGTRDATFGTGGVARFPLGKFLSQAMAVAVDSSGRIVAVGGTADLPKTSDLVVVRLRPNGTLDPTFSGDGKLRLHFSNVSFAGGMAIQNNGKIVVVGASGSDVAHQRFLILRLSMAGDLDSTFDGGFGFVTTDVGPDGDAAYGVAIQADGKLVVAGTSGLTLLPGADTSCVVVRYRPGGGVDAGFASTGKKTINPGSGDDQCLTGGIAPSGKIVAGGNSSGPGAFFAARLLSA